MVPQRKEHDQILSRVPRFITALWRGCKVRLAHAFSCSFEYHFFFTDTAHFTERAVKRKTGAAFASLLPMHVLCFAAQKLCCITFHSFDDGLKYWTIETVGEGIVEGIALKLQRWWKMEQCRVGKEQASFLGWSIWQAEGKPIQYFFFVITDDGAKWKQGERGPR